MTILSLSGKEMCVILRVKLLSVFWKKKIMAQLFNESLINLLKRREKQKRQKLAWINTVVWAETSLKGLTFVAQFAVTFDKFLVLNIHLFNYLQHI